MEGKERGGAKGGGDKIIKHFRVETQKKTLKTRRTCKNDKTYKTLNPPRSCELEKDCGVEEALREELR